MIVSHDESELRFSMGEDEDLADSEFVHSNVQDLLLVFSGNSANQRAEFFFEFLADTVFSLFDFEDFFHDNIFQFLVWLFLIVIIEC